MWKRVLYLSVFDHWLTELEAEQCSVMCYQQAFSKHALTEYLDGEQKFLSFYQSFSQATILNHGLNCATVAIDFDKTLISSLRENVLMDLYIPEFQLRFQGGFDRTDLIFITDEKWLPEIKRRAAQSGLNIIDSVGYEMYRKAMQLP